MDIEFVIRRLLRAGHDYAKAEYDERGSTLGVERYYLNRYTAQIHLLNHLQKQFLEGNQNDKQD